MQPDIISNASATLSATITPCFQKRDASLPMLSAVLIAARSVSNDASVCAETDLKFHEQALRSVEPKKIRSVR